MEEKYIPKHLKSNHAASMTDCTGLMPVLPDNEFEDEAYEDIYPVPEQEIHE